MSGRRKHVQRKCTNLAAANNVDANENTLGLKCSPKIGAKLQTVIAELLTLDFAKFAVNAELLTLGAATLFANFKLLSFAIGATAVL